MTFFYHPSLASIAMTMKLLHIFSYYSFQPLQIISLILALLLNSLLNLTNLSINFKNNSTTERVQIFGCLGLKNKRGHSYTWKNKRSCTLRYYVKCIHTSVYNISTKFYIKWPWYLRSKEIKWRGTIQKAMQQL